MLFDVFASSECFCDFGLGRVIPRDGLMQVRSNNRCSVGIVSEDFVRLSSGKCRKLN